MRAKFTNDSKGLNTISINSLIQFTHH